MDEPRAQKKDKLFFRKQEKKNTRSMNLKQTNKQKKTSGRQISNF